MKGRFISFLWQQRGIRLLIILSLFFCLAPFLPLICHQFLYSISLTIKTILLWLMPIIVLFYLAFTIQSFRRQAPLFLVVVLLFEGLSNFSCLWYAYGLGTVAQASIPSLPDVVSVTELQPLWQLPGSRPSWYAVDKSSLLGVAIGFLGMLPLFNGARQHVTRGKEIADFLLRRLFSPLIPFFILGFIANLYVSGLLTYLRFHLPSLLPWLVGGVLFYLGLLFFASGGGVLKKSWVHLKNLLPAGGLALTSGCSLSTMPWTIEGTRKNLQDPYLANAIIPATTNIQQVGDCIINGFLSYVIYLQFMGHAPTLKIWLPFALVFTLARFTTAAVLGGAIFIMLPIYEAYLHFTPSMMALILAFNVLLDPIVTSGNVMANGALCSVFEKVWQKVKRARPHPSRAALVS